MVCYRTFKGDFGKLRGWLTQGASYPRKQARGAGPSPAAGGVCGERGHPDVPGLPLRMPRGLAGAAAGKVRLRSRLVFSPTAEGEEMVWHTCAVEKRLFADVYGRLPQPGP